MTLVEMLAATMVLALLSLLLNSGLRMVLNTYQTMIAQSEVELLLSTAVDTLADDLRYAWEVAGDGGDSTLTDAAKFTYYSSSFGEKTRLYLDGDGKIRARSVKKPDVGWQVLSTGAYGSETAYKEYKVTYLNVTFDDSDPDKPTFTIKLTVATADGAISASTPESGVTVRCLNPYIPPAGGT